MYIFKNNIETKKANQGIPDLPLIDYFLPARPKPINGDWPTKPKI
jgi:hypothetical protein